MTMAGVTSESKVILENGKAGSSDVSHKCEICGKKFTTKFVLFRHMFVHAGRLNKKKPGCQYSHGNKQAYKSNLQKAKTPQKQKLCNQKPVTKPAVCRETVGHTEEFSNTIPSVDLCSDNQDGKISSQKSKCEICSQQFINELSLFQHMCTHTGEMSNITGKSASINGELSSETADLCLQSSENHQDCRTSSQKPKETSENRGLKCETQLSHFEHKSMHSGELSSVVQDLCYSGKNPLGYKSGEPKLKENPQKCEICGRKYVTKLSLFRHMFTHTGAMSNKISNICLHASKNPQNCKICMQKTSQNLLEFRTGSSTEESYSCSVCTKKFTFRANFLKHVCSRSQVKPHKCELCSKRFSAEGRFFRHLRTHTGELPYECDMCCRRYNNKSNLVQHLKVHETENSS